VSLVFAAVIATRATDTRGESASEPDIEPEPGQVPVGQAT